MSDPALAIQAAIVALLKATATEAGSRVYDSVPEHYALPYVTIGPTESAPTDEDCFDATESFVQIDVWSGEVGFPQVKRIASALRAVLHEQPLTMAGHVCDRMHVRQIAYSRDPDGLTSRARIDLVVDTQPQ